MNNIIILFNEPIILPGDNNERTETYGLLFSLVMVPDDFNESVAEYIKYLMVCQQLYLNNGECRQDDIKEVTYTKIEDMQLDMGDIETMWYLTNEETWRELKDKGESHTVDVRNYTVSDTMIHHFLTGVRPRRVKKKVDVQN